MTNYDVAIVGAGPAGLGAGLKAASLGLKVALIERRAALAPITRACSEGLLYEEPYNGEAAIINRANGTIEFMPSGFSLRYTGPVREIPGFANISYRGHRMNIVRDDGKPIHLVFDKARYLEENLEAAVRAGIVFFPNQTVADIELRKEGVRLQTDKSSFTARFLIAADGHNSLCARAAGFDRERAFYGTLRVACWHITGPALRDPGHLHLVEGSDDPSVFCMCPRVEEGQWSIVISGFSRDLDFHKRFEQVVYASVLAPLLKPRLTILRKLACILNLFHPLENPCRDNMFVVGDAAWLGQTSNTHAALIGARAAACVSDVLHRRCTVDDAYAQYRAWWREQYLNYQQIPGGGNIFEELSKDEIDELFSCMPDAIPGSMEPRKAKMLMGSFFQKLMPQLQQKNPSLVKKMAAIQQKSVDAAWAEKRKQGFPVRRLLKNDSENRDDY